MTAPRTSREGPGRLRCGGSAGGRWPGCPGEVVEGPLDEPAGPAQVSRARARFPAQPGLQRPGHGRWGIYVGLWAPTFMALGNAIKADEIAVKADELS
jgi:hypothetical protein